MVELIAVLIIAGILAAVATPRFFEQTQFDGRSAADQAVGMLRYAQKLAIAQNRPVFVRLTTNSAARCFSAACAAGDDRVLPPGGENSSRAATLAACSNARAWLCEGLPDKISYSVSVGAGEVNPGLPLTFYFNALGRPFSATDTEPVSTFPSSLSIAINGGGEARAVVVESETGYVHL